MGTPIRVLIVEDSEDDALLLVNEMRRGGYDPIWKRVDTSTGMNSALSECLWDVILCDYVMPNFSALEALQLTKERDLDIPFIIVSGKIGEDIAVSAMKAGAHDYIIKNNLKRLVSAVKRELREAEHRRESKRVAEELLKFHLGIERSTEVIFVTDPEGIITYVNPAFEKTYGYTREESLGKTPRILKSGTLPQEVYYQFWSTLLSKEPVVGELVNKTKDGRLLDIEGSANPILNEAGTIIGFLAIQRDITDRKRAEQARLESEEKFRSLVENINDVIFTLDERGVVTFISPVIEHISRYKVNEISGRSLTQFVNPEDLPAVQECLANAFEDRQELQDFRILNKGGGFLHFSISLRPVLREGKPAELTGVLTDITARKRAEDKIAHINQLYTILR